MKVFTMHMNEEILKQLKEESKNTGVPASAIVRRELTKYYNIKNK